MIEESQRMIKENSQRGELGGINPVIKKHFELQINTLQNALRDADDKLERLSKAKKEEREEKAEEVT
jgi:hypothetical protein